ncbi:hypothetical protein L3Q82_023482, partial [Scortum barcoo]
MYILEKLIYFWNIFKTRKEDFTSVKQWWECGKIEIKQLCQQYILNVSQDIKSMRDLETEIVELTLTLTRGCFEELKSKKAVLADLLGSKAQGALVRSHFQSTALMDASSSFFFGLEKKNGQSRFIHALRSDKGQLLTEAGEIRRRAVQFYAQLYQSEYTEDQQRAGGSSDLRGSVCSAAEVLSESLSDRSLPRSSRRAVLTLLPKKGDLQDIKNWRPVSLLCTDYKLLSKVLANRLRKVMDQVIHRTQTYCVPGRSIVDNVSLIRDILEVSGSLGFDAGLVSLDQEKAFDRVKHRYLWKVLKRFGLNPGLIAKIKEPLIHGAQLDVRDSSRPGLSQRLVSAGAVKLRCIVVAARPLSLSTWTE